MLVGRRTAGQRILSHDSDENPRRSISDGRIGNHRGVRRRDFVLGITRICWSAREGDHTNACDDLLIQVSMLLNSLELAKPEQKRVGRFPDWLEDRLGSFAGRLHRKSQVEKVMISILKKRWLERLCGTASRQPSWRHSPGKVRAKTNSKNSSTSIIPSFPSLRCTHAWWVPRTWVEHPYFIAC